MARQYSHLHFFRNVPNALLAQYFQVRHGVLADIDFNKRKETQVDDIFDAFKALPSDLQARIESECQDIETLSIQGGIAALADEADFHQDPAFPDALSNISGFHGKAMWAFLEKPDYWAGATLFFRSDNIAESSWKKRNDLPGLPPRIDADAIHALEQAIGDHFHEREGRGRNCKVEVFHRHQKEYFFAYPEDFAQSSIEWERDRLSSRTHNPAFEIIFVYCQAEGSLDIYAPRNNKYVEELQQIFADSILNLEDLEKSEVVRSVYVLDQLAERDFVFRYSPGSGITEVCIRSLRLHIANARKQHILLEADPTSNPKAIYDLMDSLNLPVYGVTQAEILVRFAPTPNDKARCRKFKISKRGWCALKHEGSDLIIRQMLADSGIEPKNPKATA